MENDGKINGRINDIFESDLAKLIKIIVFVFAIAGAYYLIETQIALMQQDIKFIKENHLVHIEKGLQDNISDHKEILKQISEINISLAKIATEIEK